jgi:SAM-dependent methyltransferase
LQPSAGRYRSTRENAGRSSAIDTHPLQTERFDRDVEYRHTPYLAQWALHDRLARLVYATIRSIADQGLPLRALEIGAGHGSESHILLSAGCSVTSVEMSRTSFDRIKERYGSNERLQAVYDRNLELPEVGAGYSLVLVVSALHHLPDYEQFLSQVIARLLPGGTLLTVQDPLWYPRVGRMTYSVDRAAYLTWRLGQGQVRAGFSAMLRRIRGAYPQSHGEEIAYHHVVRNGVDEVAIRDLLVHRFREVEVLTYWSNHLSAVRRTAELAGLRNTFAVRASGFGGSPGR